MCDYCKNRHAMKKARGYIWSENCHACWDDRGPPPCWKPKFWASVYIHENFSAVVFQMAMRSHRQGSDCTLILDLLSPRSVLPPQIDVGQRSVLSRIVGGCLIIRTHWILAIPLSNGSVTSKSICFWVRPTCFLRWGAQLAELKTLSDFVGAYGA